MVTPSQMSQAALGGLSALFSVDCHPGSHSPLGGALLSLLFGWGQGASCPGPPEGEDVFLPPPVLPSPSLLLTFVKVLAGLEPET